MHQLDESHVSKNIGDAMRLERELQAKETEEKILSDTELDASTIYRSTSLFSIIISAFFTFLFLLFLLWNIY